MTAYGAHQSRMTIAKPLTIIVAKYGDLAFTASVPVATISSGSFNAKDPGF